MGHTSCNNHSKTIARRELSWMAAFAAMTQWGWARSLLARPYFTLMRNLAGNLRACLGS
jgi:hypothetical protein